MKPERNIDVNTLLDSLRDGESITLPVQGVSMMPFLKPERDTVKVEIPTSGIKKGDIVLYKKGSGIVMHRVFAVDGDSFSAVGDNETGIESGIPMSYVRARVTQVNTENGTVKPQSFRWRFFSWIFTNEKMRNSSIVRRTK